MSDVMLSTHGTAAQGRILAQLAGSDAAAELTWHGDLDGTIIADHTFVPDAFRGKGVAAMLVAALIAKARQEGWKIVPQCSYVAAAFQRNPDWADLRA